MLETITIGTFIVIATALICMLWELIAPARIYSSSLKSEVYIDDILIFGFNNVVTFLLSISTVWIVASNFSLSVTSELWNAMPIFLQLIVGFLLLDLMIWVWHRSSHKNQFLWRFHQAHHSEKYLNSLSALRFHIGELLLSVIFKVLILVVTGIPLWIFAVHEIAITVFAIFHHANVKLNDTVEKYVRMILITPRMHYAHHSSIKQEHNSNYGVVFSWWDTIFSTINKKEPKEIGLSYTKKYRVWDFLIMPFTDVSDTPRILRK